MKKKNILIAILCASILLLVPLTNISSASVGRLNTKIEVNENDYVLEEEDVTIIDEIILMLNELKVNIHEILLKFGHIPGVKENCQELLDAIDIDIDDLMKLLIGICIILFIILAPIMLCLFSLMFIGYEIIYELYRDIYVVYMVTIFVIFIPPFFFFGNIFGFLNCHNLTGDWPYLNLDNVIEPVLSNFESDTGVNLHTYYDFFSKYELYDCPCMQE